MVSAPAFQFKGSGWYATDYAVKSGSSEDKRKGEGEGAKPKSEGETLRIELDLHRHSREVERRAAFRRHRE